MENEIEVGQIIYWKVGGKSGSMYCEGCFLQELQNGDREVMCRYIGTKPWPRKMIVPHDIEIFTHLPV